MKYLILFLSSIFLLLSSSFAQTQPNIGFEYNNFTNWKTYFDPSQTIPSSVTYATTPITGLNTTYNNLFVNTYANTAKVLYLETTSGTGVDKYGGYPLVCNLKGAGQHSCKLGSDSANSGKNTYSSAQGISYNIKIPANSNKYKIVFYYAIDLEDPGSHNPWEMPLFLVNAFDSANPNNVINCAQFLVNISTVKSDPLLDGNWGIKAGASPNGKDVYYTPWTPATLIAKNMGGKTLTIRFMSAGCSPCQSCKRGGTAGNGQPGAHFGYAYVDFDTTTTSYSDSLKYCPHDTCLSLTPPPGYKGYIVIDSITHKVIALDTSHPVSSVTTFNLCGANLPKPKSVLQVILTPYAGFGCIDTLTYYVDTFPTHILPPIISPKDSICVGVPMTLTDAAPNGNWVSENVLKGTIGNNSGTFNGLSNGLDTILYHANNTYGCPDTTYKVLYVGGLVLPEIIGKNGVCIKDTTQLSDSITLGIWTSSNTAIATISPTGIVTGLQYGSVIITYTYLSAIGCYLTVNKNLQIGVPPLTPITGNNTFCGKKGDTLYNTTIGGTWVSTNTSVATINSNGVVTGISLGISTIKYIYSFGGCSDSVTYPITVAGVTVASITGKDSVCINSSNYQYNDITAGGNWSTTNTNAIISNNGSLTALQTGIDTIKYVYTNNNGCSDSVTKTILILSLPVVGSIKSPANSICIGSTLNLTDSIKGGTWVSSNPAVANITNSGVVIGISAGTTTITYSISSFCNTASQSITLTINDIPAINVIQGNNSVCVAANIPLTNASAGGIWTSNNTAVATISNNGIVSGVTTGTAIITYALTNVCGTSTKTTTISVIDIPVVPNITGNNTVCVTAAIQLKDSAANGIWTSNNQAVAAVNNIGVVSGIAIGSVIIKYAVSNICGTVSKNITISVNDLPVVGNISGNNTLCARNSTQLSDTTNVGNWTSADVTVATVNNSGLVTGITTGNTLINYTVTNSCGSTTKPFSISIIDVPKVADIIGNSAVCKGTTLNLYNPSFGGVWNSNNPSVATVNNNGVVAGISLGNTVISFAVTNTCGITTRSITIFTIDIPVVAPILGSNTVCQNDAIIITDSTIGGIWSSSNNNVATFNVLGTITGESVGTAIISYAVTNICGTTTQYHPVTVLPIPSSALSLHPSIGEICIGDSIVLKDSTTGNTVDTSIWLLGNGVKDTSLNLTYIYPKPGNYLVRHYIIDQDGCLSTPSTIKIMVDPLPVVTTQPIVYVLQYNSVILQPTINGLTSNSAILWTPDVYLNNNNLLNPISTPVNDTTYNLTITTEIGCKASDTTRVIVLQLAGIPNVFSPNGDGIHDTWDIPTLHKFPAVKVDIFDRNGQVVYHSYGPFQPWDGKYKGSPVPTAVYYYIIDRGFNLPILSGSVTVIR